MIPGAVGLVCHDMSCKPGSCYMFNEISSVWRDMSAMDYSVVSGSRYAWCGVDVCFVVPRIRKDMLTNVLSCVLCCSESHARGVRMFGWNEG